MLGRCDAMSATRAEPWIGKDSDNLTGLSELNETSLLKSIKKRYESDSIYTDVGDILVAVNPFRELSIYQEPWSQAFRRPDVSALAPHIYRVAARAFNSMVQGKKDQVCVISGESGAGKTESAKFIMQQLMTMCRSAGLGQRLQERIIQLNPILEAFGNASTALNDNSSRFGKFIQLVFEPNGRIVGAGLEQYLLEKSRVCVQGEKERNFHIFYYLYAGLAPEMLEQFHLRDPSSHRYLRSYENAVADCRSAESKAAFDAVLENMRSIGFSEDEIRQVVTVMAAIISIGDIDFTGGSDGSEDAAEVSTRAVAEQVTQVLQLESCDELCFALTTLRTTTRGETVDKRYSCRKAADVRDAAAKALYARVFHWMVARLNSYLQPRPAEDDLHLGILDIFGFENFTQNSFEQFCINLANEQLQQYFNHQIFAMEKMEYAKEGVDGLEIKYRDNKPVLDLFLSRPIGLLSLLDEQCRGLNGTEKAFVQRCRESFAKHASYVPHRGDALVFSIKHYAGDVEYGSGGFLEKNKDALPDAVVEALRFSSLRLLRTLFTRDPCSYTGSQLKKSVLRKSQRLVMRAMSKRRRPSMKKQRPGQGSGGGGGAGAGGKRKLLTVSAHFRESLDRLMERVFAASPHFVRCIKPNIQKLPTRFEDDLVLKQLRYTGMLEAVRVRREGFAYRPFFSDFVSCYRPLAYYFTDKSVKCCEWACREILGRARLEGWRIGRSRVFLRYFHEERLQLLMKEMEDKATLVQKVFRGHRTRKWVRPLQETQKREKALVTRFLSGMSQHGQECFPKLLVLNRVDILQAVQRFGNKSSRDKHLAESAEDEDVSTLQRKRNKAQKVGILVPVFGQALAGSDAPILPQGFNLKRVSREVDPPRPQEEEEEAENAVWPKAAKEKRGSGDASIPNGSVHTSEVAMPEKHILESKRVPKETTSSVPPSRVSRSPHSSPQHRPSPLATTSSASAGGSSSHESHKPMRVPVNGVKLLPSDAVPPRPQGSKQPPATAPKPGTPPPRQTPGDSKLFANGFSIENPSFSNRPGSPPTSYYNTLPTPTKSSSLGSSNSLSSAEGGGTPRRRPLAAAREGEVSLDFGDASLGFSFIQERTGLLNRTNSSSVPDLLSDEPDMRSPQHLYSNKVHLRHRQLASSLGDLLDDGQSNHFPVTYDDGIRPRTSTGSSSASGHSESSKQAHLPSSAPPPPDKRSTLKSRFGFGKHRAFRKEKKKSRSGSASEAPTSPPPVAAVSDVQVLGLYPNLTVNGATEMVLGQPRGTYVIYKEDSRIYSEEPRWEPLYHLVVSGGRSVHMYSVICTSYASRSQFYVENSDTPTTFSTLKSLLDYYKRMSLPEGLYLLQPRLFAGVSVTGLSVGTGPRPGKKRNKVGGRRKS